MKKIALCVILALTACGSVDERVQLENEVEVLKLKLKKQKLINELYKLEDEEIEKFSE